MKPFVLNRHGRLVFPANFLGDLDFSVLETLEHLFFYVFDVGEPVPTSDIAVFTGPLKLQNEFFH